MKKFGLIGYPLSHSFSPTYFAKKFEREKIEGCAYDLYPLEQIEMVKDLFASDLLGLNVTIPYKEVVIPFLDEIDESAAAIGAVNTIKIVGGKTKGFNTDVWGFEQSLRPLLTHHQKALILGTGGAAKAVQFVLDKLYIAYKLVSRTPEKKEIAYTEIDKNLLSEYTIIVNTTPLGMSPKVNACPNLPYEHIHKRHLLYDLVYNPAETLFMQKGKTQGAVVKNGLEMLELQAEKAWDIWNDAITGNELG